MATTFFAVPAGVVSASMPVNGQLCVSAGPSVLGGSVLVEFSRDGRVDWRPWIYGTITQGGSFRPDTTGYVRVTAATSPANVFMIDMGGSNSPVVDQVFNVNQTLASASATAEQVLLSVRIPPLFLGPSFNLELCLSLTLSNNANVKTLNVRWNGIGGTAMYTAAVTSFLNYNAQLRIIGRGDGQTLLGTGAGASGGIGGSTTAAPTLVRDYINQESELVITATKATAGDTFQLETCVAQLF